MTRKLFIGLMVLTLWLSGCSLPGFSGANPSAESTAPRAWFDAPLPNSVFTPPSPVCQIIAHGASPNGISLFELSINGAVVASIPSPDTQGSLVTLTRDCGLSEPGEYQLQIRAQDNDGEWSGFAETNLVITGGKTETPTAVLPATEPAVSETPTLVPSPTPTSPPTGSVTVEQVSNDLIYIGRAGCGSLEVTITAHAIAPKGIKVVVLFYRFEPGSDPGQFDSVAMNPIGGDSYQGVLNPTSLMGGNVPFEQSTLQYQIVVQQSDGDTSLRTPLMADIAVQACGNVTAACSSYTDQRSCESHRCNWVSIPGTVPLFECRNP